MIMLFSSIFLILMVISFAICQHFWYNIVNCYNKRPPIIVKGGLFFIFFAKYLKFEKKIHFFVYRYMR